MKHITVTAYPYAMVYGHIDIPDDVDDIDNYLEDNWDDINFGNPDLDYAGTDFDYEED